MRLKVILLSLALLFCIAIQASSQGSPSYTVTDPAIREMLASLDMPRVSFTESNVAGNWYLALSNGPFIELALIQSGAVVFGRASVNSGINQQWATASGEISGNILRLNVVPEMGTELYAISVNIDRLPLTGTYVLIRGDAGPQPGSVSASRHVA
ncbi:MAG TPA: hypothetical protein VLB04_12880 [Methanotrichaceae archaeon]|nr:hypothetical protein [Methanotrichaceae archaeon]